jgi:hypothetical protein
MLDRIRAAQVALLGCGGIGSMAAMALAGAGITHLHLVDPDLIEESNLNRQFFWTTADIGRPKVDVLARAISRRFCDVTVSTSRDAISPDNLHTMVGSATAILITADQPFGLGSLLCDNAAALDTFVIQAGYTVADAGYRIVGPLAAKSPKSGWQWCRLPDAIMPSCGPTNAELGGIASRLVLMSLMGTLPRDVNVIRHWSTSVSAANTVDFP